MHLAHLRPVATLDRQVREGVLLAGLDIGEAELNCGSERPSESGKAGTPVLPLTVQGPA